MTQLVGIGGLIIAAMVLIWMFVRFIGQITGGDN